jgi:hypothetical protein
VCFYGGGGDRQAEGRGLMAKAELTVGSEGEEIVFGIPGGLDIRMSLEEAEEFEIQVRRAVIRATFEKEARWAGTATTIEGVKGEEAE